MRRRRRRNRNNQLPPSWVSRRSSGSMCCRRWSLRWRVISARPKQQARLSWLRVRAKLLIDVSEGINKIDKNCLRTCKFRSSLITETCPVQALTPLSCKSEPLSRKTTCWACPGTTSGQRAWLSLFSASTSKCSCRSKPLDAALLKKRKSQIRCFWLTGSSLKMPLRWANTRPPSACASQRCLSISCSIMTRLWYLMSNIRLFCWR